MSGSLRGGFGLAPRLSLVQKSSSRKSTGFYRATGFARDPGLPHANDFTDFWHGPLGFTRGRFMVGFDATFWRCRLVGWFCFLLLALSARDAKSGPITGGT